MVLHGNHILCGANDRCAEARRRAAADRRRPGESLLFSSLEMNSEFRDRRARREGRQGGTNDSYAPKGM